MALFLGAAIALSLSFVATTQAAILVNVDKSSQILTVSVGGETRYEWPVSTGRAGSFETPSGTFRVFRVDASHMSDEYGVPMPYAIFFTRGIALH